MRIRNRRWGVIYKITSPNGRVYIGQTIKFGQRMRSYRRGDCKGQKFLCNSFIKYGFKNHKIEILEKVKVEDLNAAEIKYIEQERSFFFENKDRGMNLTKGGDSIFGYKMSDETKRKIGLSNKGKLKGRKRPPFSDETKRKLSEKAKNRNYDRLFKKVVQMDKEKNILKVWDNMKEAVEELNIKHSSISSCCTGRFKSAGGFVWRFLGQENNPILLHKSKKIINQYTKFGDFIKEWTSMGEAGRSFGVGSQCISQCAKGKIKTAYGFIWRYKDEN